MWTFVHDSDLHYGKTDEVDPFFYKEDHPEKILETTADFVIATGDLTDHGWDGSYYDICGYRYYYGGKNDEVGALMTHFVNRIENGGKPVYMINGNHDRGKKTLKFFRYSPIKNIIRKRYGSLNYHFEHKGIRFICCGEYPKDLKWLKRVLDEDADQPTFVCFHFNLEGPYSDWWSDKEKENFYDVVKDYKILSILCGHRHISAVQTWKDIQVILSARQSFALITINPETESIEDVQWKS
jgi:predicted phosphodiesterase